MTFLDQITAKAASDLKHIVLAEGSDQRIVRAAFRAARDGVARITLLGSEAEVNELAGGLSADAVNTIQPDAFVDISRYAELYISTLRKSDISEQTAIRAARKPLNFAHLMVLAGDADGALAGAANSSAQVIRSASQIIGQDPGDAMISSLFLMVMEEEFHVRNGVVAFADCALTVEPDSSQLADIAATTADSFQRLLGLDPKVALLSFVTGDSANASVRKIAEAGEILAQLRPDLDVDAPVQFDAAFSPEVAAIKAPGSDVAGQANIFVFPDLNSANIGYKIAERIGRAKAIGPIMQGFAKPVNDLSRGCSEDDIYAMIALTAIQAQSA